MSRVIRWGVFVSVVALAAVLLLRPPSTAAHADAGETETADHATEPKAPFFKRDFGKLYPADPGALTYEQMSADERVAIDEANATMTAKHGQSVHDAWAQGAAELARQHRQRIAERKAGLEGMVDLGVE